jgi:hypothetical protein
MSKEELIDLFYDNISNGDWERYDFVDPPYCWSVMAAINVDGYEFSADGVLTLPDDYEVQSLEVTTPDGETITLI